MCGSMVDIQSPTVKIRRGKKKKDTSNHSMKIQWSAVLRKGDNNQREYERKPEYTKLPVLKQVENDR